jgi:hypothetical protein
MNSTVRVHETDSAGTVAFNLDDMVQLDSYVRTLAANVGTRLLAAGDYAGFPHIASSAGQLTYRAVLESQSRGRVEVVAGPERGHAHDCYTCYCAFDRSAGNATAPFATRFDKVYVAADDIDDLIAAQYA